MYKETENGYCFEELTCEQLIIIEYKVLQLVDNLIKMFEEEVRKRKSECNSRGIQTRDKRSTSKSQIWWQS